MSKRLITKRQEEALRLVHQDFEGLEQAEAAKRMGISQQALSKLLIRLEKNPRFQAYFPVLTKLEAKVYHLYTVEGWSVEDIAEHFRLTPNSVYKSLQRARDKGMFFGEPKGRVLSYEPSMDGDVKHKF